MYPYKYRKKWKMSTPLIEYILFRPPSLYIPKNNFFHIAPSVGGDNNSELTGSEIIFLMNDELIKLLINSSSTSCHRRFLVLLKKANF